jgi:hypothetical protein
MIMTRYLSGLCVAGLGLCGGGWLIVATEAFGGADAGGAGRVNLATGAGLILASCVAMVAWAVAWRRRMRMDGVLGRRFLLVSRREARRNRRELARDIRRATRVARRASRQARCDARRPARLADGAAAGVTGVNGAAGNGYGHVPHHGGGHDGVSVADVLGELRTLRTLLGPLVATTAHVPVLQARLPHPPASQARPERREWPPRGAGLLDGDDELPRLADSEEAWW